MTITEKILANAAGLDSVKPGDFVTAKLSLVLANDITAPISIREFRGMGATKVFDPERVVLVADHNTPNKDIQSAENTKLLRDFAHEQGLRHFYEAQGGGIEHIIVPRQGPGPPRRCHHRRPTRTPAPTARWAPSPPAWGSTDAAAGMALGENWFRIPETMKFVFTGALRPWVGGKDLILYTIGKIGVDGARYRAMEFAGPVIESLEMAGRFNHVQHGHRGGREMRASSRPTPSPSPGWRAAPPASSPSSPATPTPTTPRSTSGTARTSSRRSPSRTCPRTPAASPRSAR